MGIRYEKDTILNWINEMGKFLRLLVEKWEGKLIDSQELNISAAYKDFFLKEREDLINKSIKELLDFVRMLEPEQIRPLALLFMYDGLLNNDKILLAKAKHLFEFHMRTSSMFSFEDFEHLSKLDQALQN